MPLRRKTGGAEIHKYTLAQLVRYAETVPVQEIAFIEEAYHVNLGAV